MPYTMQNTNGRVWATVQTLAGGLRIYGPPKMTAAQLEAIVSKMAAAVPTHRSEAAAAMHDSLALFTKSVKRGQ